MARAFYAHNVHTSWLHDPDKPEQFGFLSTISTQAFLVPVSSGIGNQVQRFHIRTPDGEVLWAWHILPLALYAGNERALIEQPVGPEDYEKSPAFRLLAEDPESRLVIYCK